MPAPVHRSAWFVALAALGVALALWFGRRYQTAAQIARARRALSRALRTKADVRAACTHPEIGPIDFRWGTSKGGIRHIQEKHPEDLPRLPEILLLGEVRQGVARVWITHAGFTVLLSKDYYGKSGHWVVTTYENKNAPADKAKG
jgi:hypothetical protein